jgi:Putative beta-barrel porin-2, OmpL-like. bbp2
MEYPQMKRIVTLCAAFGAGFMMTSFALASEPQLASPEAGQPVYMRGTMAAYFADAEKPKEGEPKKEEKPKHEEKAAAPASCGCESKACGSDASSCGSEAGGCGSECKVGGGTCFCENWGTLCCVDNTWPFSCCCKPGDPCTLQSHLTPCCKDTTYGGWFAFGFYSNNDPLSTTNNDLLSFWDRPNELNLDQAWFYAEHLAKSDGCNWACGYRFDLVYGVDAQKTQSFGNSGFPAAQGYDNGWDNGAYGWALPQAYVEFAKGDWDIKAGHFFTPIGYEVIPATGNFFYSHSFTMFNSEPFTHTGVLSTYKASDCVTYYMGWTQGWDTGFDQFGNGNSFLGGVALQLNDSVKYTYLCTAGDLGWRGDSGYSHSNVFDFTLSKKWEYVLQSDLLTADGNANGTTGEALSYGVNNYLFYTINDCWKWGTRAEWWKSNTTAVTSETSFYEVATGLNYKVNANFTVRPEVKFNWTPSDTAYSNATGGADFNQTLFGMDAIYTF